MYKEQTLRIRRTIGPGFEFEDVSVKDLVLGWFEKEGVINNPDFYDYAWTLGLFIHEDGKYVKITKLIRREYSGKIYKITTESGKSAQVTSGEVFKLILGNGREIDTKAKDLIRGDLIKLGAENMGFDNKLEKIVSISMFDNDDSYVYELETETGWYDCNEILIGV